MSAFYKNVLNAPGVNLGNNGIKIHFDKTNNAIAAVLNLRIDIKETANAATALSSWAAFKNYSKKNIFPF